MQHILVIEDDSALAMGIEYALQEEQYEVTVAGDCRTARELLQDICSGIKAADLMLLDVMLPDGTGYELLKEYREAGVTFPVIFLTAVADEGNVVRGLDLGADDYIAKPFRVRELMSRIRAVLRRTGNVRIAEGMPLSSVRGVTQKDSADTMEHGGTVGIISFGEIRIDTNRAEAFRETGDGKAALHLTRSEYRLLLFLISNKGITLSRNRILEELFDEGGSFVDDNTLSVYINRLREKIGDLERKPPYIETVRGVGYRISL